MRLVNMHPPQALVMKIWLIPAVKTGISSLVKIHHRFLPRQSRQLDHDLFLRTHICAGIRGRPLRSHKNRIYQFTVALIRGSSCHSPQTRQANSKQPKYNRWCVGLLLFQVVISKMNGKIDHRKLMLVALIRHRGCAARLMKSMTAKGRSPSVQAVAAILEVKAAAAIMNPTKGAISLEKKKQNFWRMHFRHHQQARWCIILNLLHILALRQLLMWRFYSSDFWLARSMRRLFPTWNKCLLNTRI
mmetsp:Transcript_37139/g.111253  ORF Transcript_37139/g.111253 Transcript_37139/m.111253 type:complete len:245 (-) Transcript_37139:674-1408(-)